MDLSIVVPARNEEDRIGLTLQRLVQVVGRLRLKYEIVVGDSASSDDTVDRAMDLRLPGIRVVRSNLPGKGRILTKALATTKGTVTGFVDADMEIDPAYIPSMYRGVIQGAEAVIASKTLVPGMDAKRPRHRRLATTAYNAVVRGLFATGLADHQAGLKLFHGPTLRLLLPRIRSTEWLWDTEVLVALHQRRSRIVEVPVELAQLGPSHVSVGTNWLGTARDLTGIYVRSKRAWPRVPTTLTETA